MSAGAERFIHENRGLAEWLEQIVSQEAGARRAAARVLTERFFCPEDLIRQGVDMEVWREEYQSEVRKAVNGPGFPAVEFVRKLLSLHLAVQER